MDASAASATAPRRPPPAAPAAALALRPVSHAGRPRRAPRAAAGAGGATCGARAAAGGAVLLAGAAPRRRPLVRLGGRRAGSAAAARERVRSAYVHIPFCRQRCRYCDFPIAVLNKEAERAAAVTSRYVDNVVREIQEGGAGAFDWTDGSWEPSPLETVYFGGGTPSLLPTEGFRRILEALRQRFGLAPGAEITVELDPGTFDGDKARGLAALGVNRASIGTQSLDDDTLELCGRGHTGAEALAAVETVLASGVANVSVDFLSGVPGQSEEALRRGLRRAAGIGVSHVSVYDLQYEPGTPFERLFPEPGEAGRPSDDSAADLYVAAHEELAAAGFEHYEVSSFARLASPLASPPSRHRSRHNLGYWSGRPYAAFGNGAASFVGGVRSSRPRGVEEYCSWVQQGGPEAQLADVDTSPRDDPRGPLYEALMLGLRTSDGVALSAGGSAAGSTAGSAAWPALEPLRLDGDLAGCLDAAAHALQPWAESGHAEVDVQRPGGDEGRAVELRARLLPPHGFLVSNTALSDVFAAALEAP